MLVATRNTQPASLSLTSFTLCKNPPKHSLTSFRRHNNNGYTSQGHHMLSINLISVNDSGPYFPCFNSGCSLFQLSTWGRNIFHSQCSQAKHLYGGCCQLLIFPEDLQPPLGFFVSPQRFLSLCKPFASLRVAQPSSTRAAPVVAMITTPE